MGGFIIIDISFSCLASIVAMEALARRHRGSARLVYPLTPCTRVFHIALCQTKRYIAKRKALIFCFAYAFGTCK